MDEIKKEQQELFKSTIARLKTAGVDTNCYKDVVIALETEIRHYQAVIDSGPSRKLGRDPDDIAFRNFISGERLGRHRMAARIIEFFMADIDSCPEHQKKVCIEDVVDTVLSAWMEIQDEVDHSSGTDRLV